MAVNVLLTIAIIEARTVSAVCRPASHLRMLLIRSRRRMVFQFRRVLVVASLMRDNGAEVRSKTDMRCFLIS